MGIASAESYTTCVNKFSIFPDRKKGNLYIKGDPIRATGSFFKNKTHKNQFKGM